jgi:NADH:ubiquinone reductase (H+-translocating)
VSGSSQRAGAPAVGDIRNRRRVVVIGGGFAGLHAVKALRRAPVDVVLIDRTNHHLFQPLLYQVATAGLSPGDIARPLRAIFRRQANATVLMADVVAVHPERRAVELHRGERVCYDWLVVAVGARHSYFGRPEWEPLAPGLKTLDDALQIREKVLLSFERAERAAARGEPVDPRDLTFVVVGAGPTGVEMAGAIAEIAHDTLRKNFRLIDPAATRVHLIEGEAAVLPPFPEELRASALRQLRELRIDVRLRTKVVAIDEEGVTLELPAGDGASAQERIATRNVVWAAGNQVDGLLGQLPGERDRAGRLTVGADLSLPQRPEVFVAGDAARFVGDDGAPLPALAPVAMQQGRHAARCVLADLRGRPRPLFRYRDRGTMATIGKARAVAWIHRLRFGGLLAWLVWSLVHIAFLIGFRNRTAVMLEWIYLYLTGQRGARLLYGRSIRRIDEGG